MKRSTLKRALFILWIFVLLHTIKDIFQDFLEWDVLTFADANENLWALPKWGRWMLALANETAVWVGLGLVILTPFVFKHRRPLLEKALIVGFFFFFLLLATDVLLDPRITNPKLFFDKSTRVSANQMKTTYQEIIRQGPF